MKHFNPILWVKRFLNFYSTQNSLENRLFWRITPMIALVGIGSVLGTISEGLGLAAVLSGISCLVAAVILAVACYKSGNDCKRFYVYLCIVLNCVLMPVVFLTNGGIDSGMPMYCFAMTLLCAFCTTKKARHITASLSFFVYIMLFAISSTTPEIVTPIRENFIHVDIVLSFAVAVVSLLVLVSSAVSEISRQRYDDVNSGMIAAFSRIIEFRNLETGAHVKNIRGFMIILLQTANEVLPECSYDGEEVRMISSAALLHDIGKIAVPDNVLNKPGRLTPEEFELIKNHPVDGCKMLESMREFQDPRYFDYCYEICRHHHEKYDGSGYPDGLKGEEIPIVAQLASVADVFDALTSKRPYKEAYSLEQASDIIINRSPGFYSDRVLECFRLSLPRFKQLMDTAAEEKK